MSPQSRRRLSPAIGAVLPILVAIAIDGSHTPNAFAEDWPQWRGPHRNGISRETGLLRQWPSGGPELVWSSGGLGEGYGAVAVVGDTVYVQGTRGSESVVFALERESGKRRWERSLGPRLRQDRGHGPRSTPTVEGSRLYALTGMGELAAISTTTGEVSWQSNILRRFNASNPNWGISESPLIEGNWVVVMPGGRGATVAALDKTTGETAWTSRELSERAGYSSLVATNIAGRRVLLGFTQGSGVGLDARDGSLLWRYERPANRTANVATPIHHQGIVFYTSAYGVGGGAVKIVADGNRLRAEEMYFASNLQNHHGGAVLVDGYLYSFFGRALTCVKFDTGEIVWRSRSVGKGSLTVADGLLFLVGEDHVVGLAEASPAGYRELGRFSIEDLGRPSWAHPVVSGGRLYIRNQSKLSVYDVRAGR